MKVSGWYSIEHDRMVYGEEINTIPVVWVEFNVPKWYLKQLSKEGKKSLPGPFPGTPVLDRA